MEAQIFTLPGVKLKGHKTTKAKIKKRQPEHDIRSMCQIHDLIGEIGDSATRDMMEGYFHKAACYLASKTAPNGIELPLEFPKPDDIDVYVISRLKEVLSDMENPEAKKKINRAIKEAVFIIARAFVTSD